MTAGHADSPSLRRPLRPLSVLRSSPPLRLLARSAIPIPAYIPAVTYNTFLSPDILVVRFSSIGDILLDDPAPASDPHQVARGPGNRADQAAVRPARERQPERDRGLRHRAAGHGSGASPRQIKRVRYSHMLDLQGGAPDRAAPACWRAGPWSGFSHRRVARELLIRFKHNTLSASTSRCRSATSRPRPTSGVEPDGGPPEFFLNPAAEERAAAWLARAGIGTKRPLVAIAPGRGPRHQALAGRALDQARPPDRAHRRRRRRRSAAPRTRRSAPRSRPGAAPTSRAPPAT